MAAAAAPVKKGGGAYFSFVKATREEIKAALAAEGRPTAPADISVEAGHRWRVLTAEEKQVIFLKLVCF